MSADSFQCWGATLIVLRGDFNFAIPTSEVSKVVDFYADQKEPRLACPTSDKSAMRQMRKDQIAAMARGTDRLLMSAVASQGIAGVDVTSAKTLWKKRF